jgi:hypothetical protein
MLLPVVLGSAGTQFKCFDRATKAMDIPNAGVEILYSKLNLHSIHILQNLVSQRRYLERQKPTSDSGKRGKYPPHPDPSIGADRWTGLTLHASGTSFYCISLHFIHFSLFIFYFISILFYFILFYFI